MPIVAEQIQRERATRAAHLANTLIANGYTIENTSPDAVSSTIHLAGFTPCGHAFRVVVS